MLSADRQGHSDPARPFGERLRAARQGRGWSQVALAAHLQRAQAVISRWETGEVDPGRAEVEQLERALGVSFATGTGPSPESAYASGFAAGEFTALAGMAEALAARARAAADRLTPPILTPDVPTARVEREARATVQAKRAATPERRRKASSR